MSETHNRKITIDIGRRAKNILAGINGANYKIREARIAAESVAAEALMDLCWGWLGWMMQMHQADKNKVEVKIPLSPRDGETLGEFTARRLRHELDELVGPPEAVWTGRDWKVPPAAPGAPANNGPCAPTCAG